MPLSDVQVLDLTRLLPGPFATQILADFGARVIKIEDPGMGDLLRFMPPYLGETSYAFQQLNHNKQSMVLNLKQPEGREILLKLVAQSDVLVEGFRPGVLERLKLGPDVLRAVQPGLVLARLSGYGQDGPRSSFPGHDINYQAYAGSLGLNARAGGDPLVSAVPAADLSGALYTVIGILLALRARGAQGAGQQVDVGMLDSVFSLMSIHVASAFAGRGVQPGESQLSGTLPNYSVYRCACGGHLAVGSLEPKFWSGLCQALGRPDLMASQMSEGEERSQAHAEVEAIFASRPRAAWVAELEAAGLCVSPVLSLDEAVEDPQLQARKMLLRLRDPELGDVRLIGQPIKLSQTPATTATRAPKKGEHSRALLTELGYPAAAIDSLFTAGTLA